jgi:ABC-type polysaccharide/polyol phosphate transport system ATPase subunit
MPIIEVNHITKEYRLGAIQGIKQTAISLVKRMAGGQTEARPLFKALDDVSFSIEQGEVIGVIGHNGAGKSTLLKILARISTPSHGHFRVDGRIAPLIEVGAGFIPDFTGRENVYLNGAILGMSRHEIDRKFDEIVEFADMAEFIDTPVKRYSSGMQVKLAFAVATSVEAEILVVDEVLAVGDIAFQRKCYDRVEQLVRRKDRTIILVSHNLRQVERLSSRVLMLNAGKLIHDGDPVSVCNEFFTQSNKKIASVRSKAAGRYESSPEFELLDIGLLDGDIATGEITSMGDVTVEIRFLIKTTLSDLNFTLGIHTTDLFFIGVTGSDKQLKVGQLAPGEHKIQCHLHQVPLTAGTYAIHFGVETGSSNSPLFRGDNLLTFEVSSTNSSQCSASERLGVVKLLVDWAAPEPV